MIEAEPLAPFDLAPPRRPWHSVAMFASTELARRIELAAATTLAAQAESLGGFAASIGEGTAIFAGAASPLTKALAIGFEEAFEVEALAPAEQSFAEHGAPLTIELSTLTRTGVSEALGRRGYVTVGFEDVMGLALDEVRASTPQGAELTIRTSPNDEIATFVDVSVTGFSHPDIEGVTSHESFPSDMLRFLRFTDFLAAVEPVEQEIGEQPDDSHADEVERSTMPWITPESVDRCKAVSDSAPKTKPGCSRDTSEAGHDSSTAMCRDPTLATRAKGERLARQPRPRCSPTSGHCAAGRFTRGRGRFRLPLVHAGKREVLTHVGKEY